MGEQPASPVDSTWCCGPSRRSKDRDIFAARTDDVQAAGDGSGAPAGDLEDEIRAARATASTPKRRPGWWPSTDRRRSAWFSASLHGGEVNVRIWIHPAYRKRGYGTAALRKSRSEMAAYFPAVPSGGARAGRRVVTRVRLRAVLVEIDVLAGPPLAHICLQ